MYEYRKQFIRGEPATLEITFLAVLGRGRPRRVVGRASSPDLTLYLDRAVSRCEQDAKFQLLYGRDDTTDTYAFYELEADVELRQVDWQVKYTIGRGDVRFKTFKRVNINGKYYNSRQWSGQKPEILNRWSSKTDLEEALFYESSQQQEDFVSRYR